MFETVELDTWEEYVEKLGDYSKDVKYLPIINMILTRRLLNNCNQFTDEFIAQQTNSLLEDVNKIDVIPFRPLQQMFECEECCLGCSSCNEEWRLKFPWTGSTLVQGTRFHPDEKGCARDTLKLGSIKIFSSASSSWIYNVNEPSFSVIVYKHSDSEIRINLSGYSNFSKYTIVKNTTELQRILMFFRYLCSSGRNLMFSEMMFPESDPYFDIMKSDDWMTAPSLYWGNKIEDLENRINSHNLSRAESVSIINNKFKTEIESCGGLINFMEQYYPRTNLKTLAAMCRVGEQPA